MGYQSGFRPDLFTGKTVFVPGGGGGLGRCIAHELTSLGAQVVLAGRTLDKLHWMNSEKKAPHAHSWFRTAAPLPDDQALHRAVITYASDFTLLGTSALPHGLSWMRGELVGASLDHAIWFHREARADEWLLYATDALWSGKGRGFNRGRIFNQQGELVASVAQEGMMRRRKSKP